MGQGQVASVTEAQSCLVVEVCLGAGSASDLFAAQGIQQGQRSPGGCHHSRDTPE
jgi:hypothetical protein